MLRTEGVAPPELIRQDFKLLDARERLRTSWEIEEMILIQSVQGHAHEGHGLFNGRRFPNTSLDDIACALRRDPHILRAERQELIDGVTSYVERALSGEPPVALLDAQNRPLIGVSTLRYLCVQPEEVLGGLYLGGLRDDSDLRLEVEQERGIRIGGGRCYLVNYERMQALGLNGDLLAHGEWAGDIERFKSEGLIVEQKSDEEEIVYQYIRHRRGPGASDDTAIVAAGLLWGVGVAVGVFLADAIDTLEKYVPTYFDQDERIALRLEAEFKGLRFGRKEAKTLTYLAAVPEDKQGEVPDSSLRHLLSIDRETDLCAMESHFLVLQNIPTPRIGLAHERIPSDRFYQYVRERIDQL
jgi:hypothetical protein